MPSASSQHTDPTAPFAGLGPEDDKRTWRRAVRAARRERAATRDRVTDGERLAEQVMALWAERGQPACMAAYRSLPTEPPTEPLLHRLVTAGVRVLLPDLLEDRDLDWQEVTGAPPDGPAEVGPRQGLAAIGAAGLVVVPALAVDRGGVRLGQGGGSYDRAVGRRAPGALVVALLHDGELLPAGRLPTEAHDARVDAVVTADGGLTRCGAG